MFSLRRKKKCIRFANIDDNHGNGLINGHVTNNDHMFNGLNTNSNNGIIHENGSSSSINGGNSDDDFDDYEDDDDDDDEDEDDDEMSDDEDGQDEYDQETENEEISRTNENKQNNRLNFTSNYSSHLCVQQQNKPNILNSQHQSKKPNIDDGFDSKSLIIQQIHQMQQQMHHQQIHNQQHQQNNSLFQVANQNNGESIHR